MRKIIAVTLPKGGVGKTTTAVNLAASLAAAEKKTMLIDADPAGTCSIYLGFNPDAIENDLSHVFSFTRTLKQVTLKTDIPFLDFIPSGSKTYQSEERFNRLTTNAFLLRNLLLAELLDYDYVIFDCPPYLKGITTIVLTAVNSVIIPLRAGQFSVDALRRILKHLVTIKSGMNKNLEIEGILLTMYEYNTKAWLMTQEELVHSVGEYLFKTIIPKSSIVAESEFAGKPIILFNAKSKASLAYLQLAQEIIEGR